MLIDVPCGLSFTGEIINTLVAQFKSPTAQYLKYTMVSNAELSNNTLYMYNTTLYVIPISFALFVS